MASRLQCDEHTSDSPDREHPGVRSDRHSCDTGRLDYRNARKMYRRPVYV